MKIRFAKPDDVEQIVALCHAHANFEKAVYNPAGKKELLKQYLFDSTKEIHCLIVEAQNRMIGYATFMKQFSTWDAEYYLYMDCLYLEAAARGKGTGQELMTRISEFAKEAGCREIQWQTPDFNKRAIHFYKRLGAESKSKERFSWRINSS